MGIQNILSKLLPELAKTMEIILGLSRSGLKITSSKLDDFLEFPTTNPDDIKLRDIIIKLAID